MRRFFARLLELVAEIRRRRVLRVAGLYAVSLFVVLQVADVTFEPLGIPTWWVAVLVVAGVAGFPVALVLAWMFDLTDEGVRQASPGPLSELLGRTPTRRATTVLGTAILSVALGWGAWQVWLDASLPARLEAAAGEQPPRLDPRRIAVLYLDDHSEDGDLGYLGAALTESLIHELSGVEGLEVASRNAVKAYRHTPVTLDSIVRALGVGSVVEGSVTGSGDRIRATVQLIDGEDLTHLDSRVVEGTLDHPLAFQDSLTVHVARALRQRLGQEIRVRTARAGTEDPEAWTAYARGRDAMDQSTQLRGDDTEAALRALERADSLFRVAQRRDDEWLAPLLQRALTVSTISALHGPLPGALDTARAAVADSLLEVALERNPESVEALEHRGWLRARLARTPGVPNPPELLERAESDLRRALAMDSELPGAWWTLSEVLVRQARFAEAVEAAERALKSDAFLEVEEQTLHSLYYSVAQLGPRDDAIRLCDEGRRRFPASPNFVACRFYVLGSFPQAEPDVDHARALLDTLVAVSPERARDTWRTYGTVWLARVAARAGMADSAQALLAAVREPGETLPALAYDEAHVQLLLGDEAEAVRLLDLYLTVDPDTAFLREDWWFEGLRSYGPFRELVGLEDGGG